jgi:uncharacterized membrane protein
MSVKRRRIMTVVLVLSLSLNLLIIGGITARILTAPEGRFHPPNLTWILDGLDAETRAMLHPRIEEYRDAIWPMRVAIFRAQREVNDLLTQDILDADALIAAFTRLREASIAYQETTHEQAISLFAQLNQQQREDVMSSFMRERRNPLENRDRERGDNRPQQ